MGQEAIDVVSGEWQQNPNYLKDAVSRLMAEQFELTGAVAVHASNGARDEQETMRALESAALMYSLLEAQQHLDQQH